MVRISIEKRMTEIEWLCNVSEKDTITKFMLSMLKRADLLKNSLLEQPSMHSEL